MKIETARLIEDAATELGLAVEVYEGYSGRGMYGRKTAGVVGRRQDIVRATVQAAIEAKRIYQTGFQEDLDWSWDSMGRDEIAY